MLSTEEDAQEEQVCEERAAKRSRHNPTQSIEPEAPPSGSPPGMDAQAGALALLPEAVLDHMMSLLAAGKGGCVTRSTCSWLRSAFDRWNTRLVLQTSTQLLQEQIQQSSSSEGLGLKSDRPRIPQTDSARLLDLVHNSPRVSSLTLTETECEEDVTWRQVVEAGGHQLLDRLETLKLTLHPAAPDLEAVASCSKLQHLFVSILKTFCYQDDKQPALQLQPLAGCAGTLRRLEIYDRSAVRDITPLAACTALEDIRLWAFLDLADLSPLAACVRLQSLGLGLCCQLEDLSPLAACTRLRELHITSCGQLQKLGPLASCAGLLELEISNCWRVHNISPLASCVALQALNLQGCSSIWDLSPLRACVALRTLWLCGCRMEDLSPLAACGGLQELNLRECNEVADLGPLAACAGLKSLVLEGCSKVQSLSPLAACLGLESLDLRTFGDATRARNMSSLAALPLLHIME